MASPTAPPAAMTVADSTVRSVMIRTRATAMIVPGPPRLGFFLARRAAARRAANEARLGLCSGLGDPCQERPLGVYGMRPVLCGKYQQDG